MRFAILSPIYPYRGGIAQFSVRARGDKADGGPSPARKYSIVEGNGVKTKAPKRDIDRSPCLYVTLRKLSSRITPYVALRVSASPCERRPHDAQKSANGTLSLMNGIESAYLSADTSPVTLPA